MNQASTLMLAKSAISMKTVAISTIVGAAVVVPLVIGGIALTNQQNQQPPASSPTIALPAEESQNMQEFRSQYSGFSFKYPDDWMVESNVLDLDGNFAGEKITIRSGDYTVVLKYTDDYYLAAVGSSCWFSDLGGKPNTSSYLELGQSSHIGGDNNPGFTRNLVRLDAEFANFIVCRANDGSYASSYLFTPGMNAIPSYQDEVYYSTPVDVDAQMLATMDSIVLTMKYEPLYKHSTNVKEFKSTLSTLTFNYPENWEVATEQTEIGEVVTVSRDQYKLVFRYWDDTPAGYPTDVCWFSKDFPGATIAPTSVDTNMRLMLGNSYLGNGVNADLIIARNVNPLSNAAYQFIVCRQMDDNGFYLGGKLFMPNTLVDEIKYYTPDLPLSEFLAEMDQIVSTVRYYLTSSN